MLTTIMVPLDGSEVAELALPYAERMATALGGTLHLALVVEPPAPVRMQGVGAPINVYEPVIAQLRQEAMAYLEQVRARVQRTVGSTVSVSILEGHPAAVLLDHARAAGVDLVVMTNRGQRGLTRWVVGSVADRIVHAGVVPVLVVPVGDGGSTAT